MMAQLASDSRGTVLPGVPNELFFAWFPATVLAVAHTLLKPRRIAGLGPVAWRFPTDLHVLRLG